MKATREIKKKWKMIKNLNASMKVQKKQIAFLTKEVKNFMKEEEEVFDFLNRNLKLFVYSETKTKDTDLFKELLIKEIGKTRFNEIEKESKVKKVRKLLVK